MTSKIKKALDAAMQKVSRTTCWLGFGQPDADTKICVYVEDEQETAERVATAKKNVAYRKCNMSYRPYSDDYYEYIFGECVEPNDIYVSVEVWAKKWGLREVWYFIGNRSDWYNKVYRVCFDKEGGTSLVDFDMPIPRSYGWEPFFNFVKAVYKALTFEINLFETYYKYQAVFSWKKGKMVCELEPADGYEYEYIG